MNNPMQALKIKENLRRLKPNKLIFSVTLLFGVLLIPADAQNSTAMVGFGMGQNFSTKEFYYRGTGSIFSNSSMWGAYVAFEYRPPQESGGVHFKLPTGFYAKLKGPLYFHYGLDAITSVAFNDKVRHDLGLSLKFEGLQVLVNYAGPQGWAAQLAVPIK